jgi:hypothetical protein
LRNIIMTARGKSSIDLLNVDYDDVLHLYRGWRRSEGMLRDKNKELNTMRTKVKQLQESHGKFRGQIGALENVKELTISLQSQLSIMEQENQQLYKENKDLTDLNREAAVLLEEKEYKEHKNEDENKMLQTAFSKLQGRFDELSDSQSDLEALAAEEQAMRMSAETRLQANEDLTDQLRAENKELRNKVDMSTLRLSQCDQELAHASEQLAKLSTEVSVMNMTKDRLNSTEAEKGILKGDIARLLRMLENYPAAKGFVRRWKDSDGMSFLGVGPSTTDDNELDHPDEVQGCKGKGNGSTRQRHRKRIPASVEGMTKKKDGPKWEMTPEEFAHLKRIHGNDPFPLSDTMNTESELWVPSDAASMGYEFLAARMPHAPPHVIQEFLQRVNGVFLLREKRKVGRIKESLEKKIATLTRQLTNNKPYRGVMADKQIKRLRNNLALEKEKNMQYTLKRTDPEDDTPDDVVEMATRPATELLQASLSSLESLGRHISSQVETRVKNEGAGHPSETYLAGAMWIGRNLCMLSEELAEAMEHFRSRYLREVAAAAGDGDDKRAAHRLQLLAGSGVTEAVGLVTRAKLRSREILSGTAGIDVGDVEGMSDFLTKLPIESMLTSNPKTRYQAPTSASTSNQYAHVPRPPVLGASYDGPMPPMPTRTSSPGRG